MKNLLIAFLLGTTLVLGFLYLQPTEQLGANPSNEFIQPVLFTNTVNLTGETTLGNCGSATWNPASVASSSVDGISSVTTDIAVPGLALGDICVASLDSSTSTSAFFTCTATGAATGTISLFNRGTAALDLATGTAKICYFN